MATRRYFSEKVGDQRRTARGVMAVGGALLIAAAAATYVGVFRHAGSDVIAWGLGAALVLLPARRAFAAREYLEVDPRTRRARVVARGKDVILSVEDLAPVRLERNTRTVQTSQGSDTIITYDVRPARYRHILLFRDASRVKSRAALERIAREWNVASDAGGGRTRTAGQLDQPLFLRLRGDVDAQRATLHASASKVEVSRLSPGYALASRYRSSVDYLLLLPGVVVAGGAAVAFLRADVPQMLQDIRKDWLVNLPGVIFASFLAAALVYLVLAIYRAFAPRVLRITPDVVSFRWRRLSLRRVEDVVDDGEIVIEGDREEIRLPLSFCAPGTSGEVAHEIRRLIIEVGTMYSQTREGV